MSLKDLIVYSHPAADPAKTAQAIKKIDKDWTGLRQWLAGRLNRYLEDYPDCQGEDPYTEGYKRGMREALQRMDKVRLP